MGSNCAESHGDDPFLRHCEKETTKPISGTIRGTIPQWLHGELIRVGPGIQKIGKDQYTHIFDGLAILHKFTVKDGQAWYQSRALQSDSYKKNMAANRIVVSEFGTCAHRDPCETLFGRLKTDFNTIKTLLTKPDELEITDNCCVNVGYHGDQLYAMTESNFIRRVDPDTLETLGEKTNISAYLAVNSATAHPHVLEDGTVINMGNMYRHSRGPHYGFVRIPPSLNSKETCYAKAKLIAEIPSRWKLRTGYFHSFGITATGKLIFVEAPFCANLLGMVTAVAGFMNRTFSDWIKWYPNEKTRFYVVSIEDGKVHPVIYETNKLFTFHHINAYEENGEIVVDVSGYSDAEWVGNLTTKGTNTQIEHSESPSARRYVLPLKVETAAHGENLIKSSNTSATAILRKGKKNVVDITPQHLTQHIVELPRINYKYNGQKYSYFYGLEQRQPRINYDFGMDTIWKVNTTTGEKVFWSPAADENCLASEPIFVSDSSKYANAEEDDGVILSVLLSNDNLTSISLLILNAKDMTEIGRVEFTALGTVTGTVHGQWAQSGGNVNFY